MTAADLLAVRCLANEGVDTVFGLPGEETLTRLRLAFVVPILRDDACGVIRWKQLSRFGRESGVALGNPDFVKLAESLGCRGFSVGAADAPIPILGEAFGASCPAIVDVPLDYRESLKLTEELGRLVCPL
jgi:acetolactate synthase I/II/III large subunit